jgi:hypothetical protein
VSPPTGFEEYPPRSPDGVTACDWAYWLWLATMYVRSVEEDSESAWELYFWQPVLASERQMPDKLKAVFMQNKTKLFLQKIFQFRKVPGNPKEV